MGNEYIVMIDHSQVLEIGLGYLKTTQGIFQFRSVDRDACGEIPYFCFKSEKDKPLLVVIFNKWSPKFLRRWYDQNYANFHKFRKALEREKNKTRDLS